MLHVRQQRAHVLGQFLAQQQADDGVGLVDLAQRVDAQAVLGDALAVAQAGGAGVAGAGVDLGEAVTYDVLVSRGWLTFASIIGEAGVGAGAANDALKLMINLRIRLQCGPIVQKTRKLP
jgi:hypothetical protein